MTARIIFACDKIINTYRYFVLKSIQVNKLKSLNLHTQTEFKTEFIYFFNIHFSFIEMSCHKTNFKRVNYLQLCSG